MARMTTDEILAKSANRGAQDAKKVRSEMGYLVQTDPNFRVMRSGNTLFSYYNRGNGNVDLAMDTAATPRELVKDVQEFVKAMKIAKFKRGKFDISNPQIEKVLKMAGVNYKLLPQPNGMMAGVVDF
jgi:hypothetical protein